MGDSTNPIIYGSEWTGYLPIWVWTQATSHINVGGGDFSLLCKVGGGGEVLVQIIPRTWFHQLKAHII